MNSKSIKNYAFIPAREFSKGLPNKNRVLIKYTLEFIKKLTWIDKIYIYTDDKYFDKFTNPSQKIEKILRLRKNSKGNQSIKKVAESFLKEIEYNENDNFWLFYLTIPIRKKKHFNEAYKIVKRNKYNSLISFIKSKTHPYDCWIINRNKIKRKFIKNDIYRRQDKPNLFEHHHYISMFKPKSIINLNSELISNTTYPYFVENNYENKLIEIDTKDDYLKFKSIK